MESERCYEGSVIIFHICEQHQGCELQTEVWRINKGVWGMKLLRSLLVLQTLLYLLSDGSKVNRLWLGWVLSFGILYFALKFKAILYIIYDLKQGEWTLCFSPSSPAFSCTQLL